MSLDTETISNAADIINSMLLSRAYIDDELKFTTVHWKDLFEISDLQVTDTLYNNDKNIINIIHSLIGAVDRSRVQHKLANKTITSKDSEIKSLKAKLKHTESQLDLLTTKFEQNINIDQSQLHTTIAQLSKENKSKSNEIAKLKIWTNTLKTKYQVDIKRKDLEISEFKNRLLDKRDLPSSSLTTYSNHNTELNSNLIYNNNPIIDNAITNVSDNKALREQSITNEYQSVISDLTPIIESLITENYKYSRFVQMVNEYHAKVNSQLSSKSGSGEFTNPSDVLDIAQLANIDKSTIKTYFSELQPFDDIIKPLLNNIYKLYHNLGQFTPLAETSGTNKSRMKQLENELESVKKNWKDALGIAENWKKLSK